MEMHLSYSSHLLSVLSEEELRIFIAGLLYKVDLLEWYLYESKTDGEENV